MVVLIDLIDQRFSRWLVLKRAESDKNGNTFWFCRCDCGTEKTVSSDSLRRRQSKSCGCLQRELMSKKSKERRGPKSNNWKGGRTISSTGYVLVRQPNHPNADGAGYVLEHRLAMETKLGRHLISGEIIHHKNGIRNDNRIGNLELCVKSNHFKGQRVEDLVAWAGEVLRRYAPERLK